MLRPSLRSAVRKPKFGWLAALVVAGLTAGVAVAVTSSSVSAAQPVVGIYAKNAVPVVAAESDPQSVEVGVRFSVGTPGAVVGLRFYKGAKNTGLHVGSLWSRTGTRLAEATFTAETASGWQTVEFATPVKLTPATAYVASYHTSSGFYAQQEGAFTGGATLGNATIRATQGLYAYGAGGFPTSSWNGSAYYVDVLFQTSASATTSPSAPPVTTSKTATTAPTTTKPTTAKPTTAKPTTTKPTTTAPTTTAQTTTKPTTSPTPTKTTTTTTTTTPTTTKTTAPTPTTTPTTSTPPPATTKPSAANTGVPAGTALKVVTGDQTFSTPGQVISGLDIHGFVRITASNVTLKNSIIRGGQNPACVTGLVSIAEGASATIQDSEITPSYPSACIDGVWAWNATLTRLNIHNVVDGVKAFDNVMVQNSYIHDLSYFTSDPTQGGGDTHNDGVQTFMGNVNITLQHNTIALNTQANAAFQVTQDGGGRATNLQVLSNWLDGGACTLNFAHKGGPTPMTGIYVTGNKFGRGSLFNCPILLSTKTVLTSNSGNVWADTGTPIPPPQVHD